MTTEATAQSPIATKTEKPSAKPGNEAIRETKPGPDAAQTNAEAEAMANVATASEEAAVPVPVDPYQEVVDTRAEAAAAILEQLGDSLYKYLASGNLEAPEALFDDIEELIEIFATAPTVKWHQRSWACLENISNFAEHVHKAAGNWRDFSSVWFRRVAVHIHKAVQEIPNLRDTSPVLPVEIQLETIEECVEQNLNDQQIAKIYGWYQPNGQLDTRKVKDCKAGKVDAPKTVVHTPFFGGPDREPNLKPLDDCIGDFHSYNMSVR